MISIHQCVTRHFALLVLAGLLSAWPLANARSSEAPQQQPCEQQGSNTGKQPIRFRNEAAQKPLKDDTLRLIRQVQREIGSPLDQSIFAPVDSASGQAATTFDKKHFGLKKTELQRATPSSSIASETSPQNTQLPSDADGIFTVGLRAAARQLDITAADLEDLQAYEKADALREQAAQLRAKARLCRPATRHTH